MKSKVSIASFTTILGGGILFGVLSRPTEMGLAIIAGAISLTFLNLDKFRKFRGAGFEAELVEQIQAVIEKETEQSFSGEEGKSVPDISQVDKNTRAVIDALQHPEYTWRYMGGLKKETKLSTSEIKKSLSWLKENGYAKQSLGKHGTIWNLTDDGRYLSAVIDFENIPA